MNTTKTYGSNLDLSIYLEDRTVDFKLKVYTGNFKRNFITGDKILQNMIEAHPSFGKLFFLIDTVEETPKGIGLDENDDIPTNPINGLQKTRNIVKNKKKGVDATNLESVEDD